MEDVAALEREEVVDRVEERAVDAVDRDAAGERRGDGRAGRVPEVEREGLVVDALDAVLEGGERADLVERAGEAAPGQAESAAELHRLSFSWAQRASSVLVATRRIT